MAWANKKQKINKVDANDSNTMGIYCRVSTDIQVTEGKSLQTQQQRGINKAKELGLDFIIYTDEGLSGSLDVVDRPMLRAMMNDIYTGKISSVWSIDIDRISRDNTQGGLILNDFLKYNVTFWTNDNVVDLEDSSQNLMVNIRLLFADYERKKIVERVKRGVHKAAESGVANYTILPLGYKSVDKILTVDEYESEIVKRIFELYLNDYSTFRIANILNDENVPTKRALMKLNNTGTSSMKVVREGEKVDKDNFKWRDRTILAILNNPIYKGLRIYGGIEYSAPAIISEDVWTAVQIISKTKKNGGKNNKYFFLLKGLIVCGECGRNYYGRKRATLKDNHYTCISHRHKNEWCGNNAVDIDVLNKIVIDDILNLPKLIDEKANDIIANNGNANNLKEYKEIEAKKAKYQKRVDNAMTHLLDDVITKDEYKKIKTDAEKSIASVDKYLSIIRSSLDVLDNLNHLQNTVKTVIKILQSSNSTDDEKQKAVNSIVTKIRIWKDERELHKNIEMFYGINEFSDFQLSGKIDLNYKKKGMIKYYDSATPYGYDIHKIAKNKPFINTSDKNILSSILDNIKKQK